jgi:hypothetical protein
MHEFGLLTACRARNLTKHRCLGSQLPPNLALLHTIQLHLFVKQRLAAVCISAEWRHCILVLQHQPGVADWAHLRVRTGGPSSCSGEYKNGLKLEIWLARICMLEQHAAAAAQASMQC